MRQFNPQWRNRPRKRNNPEVQLVRHIIYELRNRGYVAGKVKTTGAPINGRFIKDLLLMKGLPDIFAFNLNTKVMLGIEAKAGSNKQTDDQLIFGAHFHNPPSRIYLVIRSIEDLIEAIK